MEIDIERLKLIPPGRRTNKVLYYLLQPTLLGYWLFSEPKHEGIELADCLFLWDDTLFLIEAKTRAGRGPGSQAWVRDRLKEAAASLNNRVGMFQRGEVKQLRNAWHGLVPWDSSRVQFYYGIIIINHLSEPYDPRDLAPAVFRESKLPLQVFSLFDFVELLRFQNTAYDLVTYYELRARYGAKFKCPVHSEFNTYKEILNILPELTDKPLPDGQEMQDSMVSMANAIMHSKVATLDDFVRLSQSLLIDLAIGSVQRKAQKDRSGKAVGNRDHTTFVSSVEAVAELSRIRRCHYGRLWLEAATQALETDYSSSKIAYSPSRKRSYIMYAFSPHDNDWETKLRTKALQAMKQHDTTSCVVLGATSLSILATFNATLDWVRGKTDSELPDEYVLDTMGLFVDGAEDILWYDGETKAIKGQQVRAPDRRKSRLRMTPALDY